MGRSTCPPCVCPARVKLTRSGISGNRSGLCMSTSTGPASSIFAMVCSKRSRASTDPRVLPARRISRRYETPAKHSANDHIAEDDDQIRLLCVGDGDHVLESGQIQVWRAHMKIGHHCDLEPGVLRMPRPDWNYLMRPRNFIVRPLFEVLSC